MPLPGSPATWPPPNYSNPEVVGHYLEPILIFLMVCTGLVVPVRLYCRYNVLRCVSWDDYLIVPAVVSHLHPSISPLSFHLDSRNLSLIVADLNLWHSFRSQPLVPVSARYLLCVMASANICGTSGQKTSLLLNSTRMPYSYFSPSALA